MNRLAIPFEPIDPKARHTRSRAFVGVSLALIAAGAILGIMFYLLWTQRDTTSAFHPAESEYSARILLHPKEKEVLLAYLGNQTVFPNAPWIVQSFIESGAREITLHFADGDVVGATFIDKNNVSEHLFADDYGYKIEKQRNIALILSKNSESAQSSAPILSLSPRSGEFINRENNKRKLIYLNKSGITIRGGHDFEEISSVFVPENNETLAFIAKQPNRDRIMQLFLGSQGGHFIYHVVFSAADLTVEDIAILGQEIMNRQSLTTTALTTQDGKQFNEIVSNIDIETNITAEGDATSIELTTASSPYLHLTKTAEIATISNINRKETTTFSYKSSCMARIDFLIRTKELADLFTMHKTEAISLWNFSEIAINKGKARFCW